MIKETRVCPNPAGIIMEIREVNGESPEMQALESINEEAIPEEERCSLDDMLSTGATVFCIGMNQEPVGFMAVRSYRNLLYLAYFAVRADLRSRGIGGKALLELIRLHPDQQVIAEYEAPDVSSGNYPLRLRRKRFYLRNGFYETGWNTCYDGTEFEICCSQPDFDSDAFRAFAADIAKIVSDHIPNPFRKE